MTNDNLQTFLAPPGQPNAGHSFRELAAIFLALADQEHGAAYTRVEQERFRRAMSAFIEGERQGRAHAVIGAAELHTLRAQGAADAARASALGGERDRFALAARLRDFAIFVFCYVVEQALPDHLLMARIRALGLDDLSKATVAATTAPMEVL